MDEQLTFDLRQPTVSDAAAIAHIQMTTWREAYKGIMADTVLAQMDVAALTASWQSALSATGPGQYRVASLHQSPVAFATFGPARDAQFANYAELVALYVHPRYWRCGVGTQLVTNTENALRENYANLYLWVATANERAQRFYQQLGFEPAGKTRQNSRIGNLHEQALVKALQ